MSDQTTATGDRWHTLAASAATRDDALYPPAPIVYLAGPTVGILGVLAATKTAPGPLRVALIVAASLAAIVCHAAVVRTANRHWDERARATYRHRAVWLAGFVGDDLTADIAGQLDEPGSFTAWVVACSSIEPHIDRDDFVTLIGRVAATDQFALIWAIRSVCYPQTATGWTTSDDACDLTRPAVKALLADGDLAPAAYRAAMRHLLATA